MTWIQQQYDTGIFGVHPETGEGLAAIRVYFASRHLWAAQHFCKLAIARENEHGGKPSIDTTHQVYVIHSILAAVAFLEAYINEIFQDAADNCKMHLAPLDEDVLTRLGVTWRLAAERASFLDRYQLALTIAGRPIFDVGRRPYQDANLLRGLRNQLVHARPETGLIGGDDAFERKLRNRFEPSRITKGLKNPYFPFHCLGAGCAKWAVKSAEAFASGFNAQLGLERTILHLGELEQGKETQNPADRADGNRKKRGSRRSSA